MESKAIFITGTDTGVGKTVISAGLAMALKDRGMDVGIMKPIATGAIRRGNRLFSQDVEFLSKAIDTKDAQDLVNPYRSELPLAPEAAFRLKGKNISVKRITNCFKELIEKHQITIIEGIGGLLVPIQQNYLVGDLIRDLGAPLVIVSRNKLGTINHTLLTIKQAEEFGCNILGIIFNKTTPDEDSICQKTNPDTIRKTGKVSILGQMPYLRDVDVERTRIGNLSEAAKKNIKLDLLLRKIKTKDVTYNYRRLSRINKKHIWHPFTQMRDWQAEEPLIIQEAKGVYLKDIRGRWFLDGVSSLWVNIHGHRKKLIDTAIKKQLGKVAHSTLLGLANIPSIQLAEELIKVAPSGLTKIFYSDNGSTSVEVALKMAFGYWQQKDKSRRRKTQFVYLDNSYHGDTIGSVSVGGMDIFHKMFHPLLFNSFKVDSPYCYRCPEDKAYPTCRLACLKKLKQVLKKNHHRIAALIVEPIVQGAGGMLVWPKGILRQMRQLCNKYDVLLIADEVAVGFGRTGRMFACQHEAVSPDILCLSKGLSAGYLPLAATLVREDIYSAFLGDYADKRTFFHGHSYTGNPLACSAALSSLEIFRREKILNRLQAKISFLSRGLRKFKRLSCVGDIRQKGFMVGIELVKDKKTKTPFPWEDKVGIKVIQETRRHGLILRPLGNCIVLMPPLVITKNQLKEMLDTIYEAIKVVTEK